MKFIIIFLLTPFLAFGLTFKDGKQVDSKIFKQKLLMRSSKDVFLLRNAGLSSKDTTLNIPGGMELNSKNHERYSIYKNIMKNIDFTIFYLSSMMKQGLAKQHLFSELEKIVLVLKKTVKGESLMAVTTPEQSFLPLTILENIKIILGHLIKIKIVTNLKNGHLLHWFLYNNGILVIYLCLWLVFEKKLDSF